MTPKILVVYHGLFAIGNSLSEQARRVVKRQMDTLDACGLRSCANEILVGINGTPAESGDLVKKIIPEKAKVVYHGLDSRSENLTLIELQKWLPGHEDWYVLYFHSKTATHSGVPRWEGDTNMDMDYIRVSARWLDCMMKHCVIEWRKCVWLLHEGSDAVGCHWVTRQSQDNNQSYFAGNVWWAKASFLLTLPPVAHAYRNAHDGIGSLRARYESEVWLGNGPRLPKVTDLVTDHQLWHCP